MGHKAAPLKIVKITKKRVITVNARTKPEFKINNHEATKHRASISR